jgi:hypothetical protein
MPRSNLPPDDSHELDGIIQRLERLERRPGGPGITQLRKLVDVTDRPVLDDGDVPTWTGSKFELLPGNEDSSFTSASVSGSVTVDLDTARVHRLTMTGNVTSVTFSNVPTSGTAAGLTLYLVQDGTGTRTVTWPASVKWPGGIAPVLSTAASAVDVIVMETTDGGSVWYANFAGRAYS